MIAKNKTRRKLPTLCINRENNDENTMKPARFPYALPIRDFIYQQELHKQRKLKIKANLRLKSEIKGTRLLLCQQIKKARINKGLSQMELAFEIGMDQHYISKIETGKLNVSLDTLLKVVQHLDCFIEVKLKRIERGEQAPPSDQN